MASKIDSACYVDTEYEGEENISAIFEHTLVSPSQLYVKNRTQSFKNHLYIVKLDTQNGERKLSQGQKNLNVLE